MIILLKEVLISEKDANYFNTTKDILVENGIIKQIDNNITVTADIVFNQPNTLISSGWVDIFSCFGEPGYEHQETLESGAAAAAAGGFTQVFVLPNTSPAIDTKSQINYVTEKSKQLPITLHPMGAISKNIEGNELAEMYEMHNSGSIAFTDGTNPVQNTSILLKALQYVKAFNGILLQMPVDKTCSKLGLMNEGIVSTQIGLQGIPAFAEILMVTRDIELLKYTQSKLHITGISSIECIELINQAKQQGLQISCSIAPQYLLFCDEDVIGYDTNLKLNPPLRNRSNMMQLRQAVIDGKVDCIAAHHQPQHIDHKMCEFEYAKNGMISLQTVFATLNHFLPTINTTQLLNLLTNNARQIFGLSQPCIAIGETAEFTLFNRTETHTFTHQNNKSKSSNSPIFNLPLTGKVVGIVSKGKLHLN